MECQTGAPAISLSRLRMSFSIFFKAFFQKVPLPLDFALHTWYKVVNPFFYSSNNNKGV